VGEDLLVHCQRVLVPSRSQYCALEMVFEIVFPYLANWFSPHQSSRTVSSLVFWLTRRCRWFLFFKFDFCKHVVEVRSYFGAVIILLCELLTMSILLQKFPSHLLKYLWRQGGGVARLPFSSSWGTLLLSSIIGTPGAVSSSRPLHGFLLLTPGSLVFNKP